MEKDEMTKGKLLNEYLKVWEDWCENHEHLESEQKGKYIEKIMDIEDTIELLYPEEDLHKMRIGSFSMNPAPRKKDKSR